VKLSSIKKLTDDLTPVGVTICSGDCYAGHSEHDPPCYDLPWHAQLHEKFPAATDGSIFRHAVRFSGIGDERSLALDKHTDNDRGHPSDSLGSTIAICGLFSFSQSTASAHVASVTCWR
jgi:hypothetical protein